MSTSETVEFTVGACPCGAGNVVRHVTTQDNPWSSADISYSIDCRECRRDWTITGGGVLTNSESEKPYVEAQRIELEVSKDVRALVDALVNQYFEKFAARTMVDEWREMQRLDITTMNINQFRRAARNGERPAQRCYGLRNHSWIFDLAEAAGKKEELTDSLARLDQAKRKRVETAKGIVRRRLD